MRLVIQRVARAVVRVDAQVIAEIGQGLLVFVGVGKDDGDTQSIEWLAGKVHHLRVFEDGEGRMNRSVADVRGEVLVVPNFTLYGEVRKGRRPSWDEAAPPETAEGLVEAFALALERQGTPVRRGAFRRHMNVELVNDGPVTLLLDA